MGDKKPQQRAEIALHALGLDYGEGYGTSYYTSINRKILTKGFEACPDCKSFGELEAATKQLQLAVRAQCASQARLARALARDQEYVRH